MGLVANIVEGDPKTISAALPDTPATMAPMCAAWKAWRKTKFPVLEGIDSGL